MIGCFMFRICRENGNIARYDSTKATCEQERYNREENLRAGINMPVYRRCA